MLRRRPLRTRRAPFRRTGLKQALKGVQVRVQKVLIHCRSRLGGGVGSECGGDGMRCVPPELPFSVGAPDEVTPDQASSDVAKYLSKNTIRRFARNQAFFDSAVFVL